MTEQQIIQFLWRYGHFRNPNHAETWNVDADDLTSLRLHDREVMEAARSYQENEGNMPAMVAAHHGRSNVVPDGGIGPATVATMKLERCGYPDFGDPHELFGKVLSSTEQQPAVGRGNWPRCHGVGDFHSAIVRWDMNRISSHVRDNLTQILTLTQRAYAEHGLLFRFVDKNMKDLLTGEQLDGRVNIEASFVSSSRGWIGLAIVGRNQTCNSNIWCRYLATYRGGNSVDAIVAQWVSLVKHELGHNCGYNHSRGGVMNPSIVGGLPWRWVDSDPTTPLIKRDFGGEAVPINDGDNGSEKWTEICLKSNRNRELCIPVDIPMASLADPSDVPGDAGANLNQLGKGRLQ